MSMSEKLPPREFLNFMFSFVATSAKDGEFEIFQSSMSWFINSFFHSASTAKPYHDTTLT